MVSTGNQDSLGQLQVSAQEGLGWLFVSQTLGALGLGFRDKQGLGFKV